MRRSSSRRGTALILGVAASAAWVTAGPASADNESGPNAYTTTVLVADDPAVGAPVTDTHLVNPWGIAFGPTTPLWVSNNRTASSTLYRSVPGPAQVPLVVTTQPSPTGVVFNSTTEFKLPDGSASRFLFDSRSGQISAWSGPPVTTTMVSMAGADYTGLAITDTPDGARLFAADAASKLVQVFNGDWDLVGVLSDRKLPDGLFPYNVAVLDGKVYVSYAPPASEDDTADVQGAIDVYSLDGRLERRLITAGVLHSPWGMAIAPAHWGAFGGALLVGNKNGGNIHAFDPRSGRLLGTLRGADGQPVGEDGLWGLAFGNGVIGTPDDLVISIGAEGYRHGLVELVSPAQSG